MGHASQHDRGLVDQGAGIGETVTRNVEDESVASGPGNASPTEAGRESHSVFRERPPEVIEVAPQVLRHRTRRDVLLFGAGAVAALVSGGSLLPQRTLKRLGI